MRRCYLKLFIACLNSNIQFGIWTEFLFTIKFIIKFCYIRELTHCFKNIVTFSIQCASSCFFNLRFDTSWHTLYEFWQLIFISLPCCHIWMNPSVRPVLFVMLYIFSFFFTMVQDSLLGSYLDCLLTMEVVFIFFFIQKFDHG